jgi:UDP:flavonoid glycosyltransferase YjiC (YdhE family)
MKFFFKVYPQKSHFNATFPLAQALRKRGHEIVYGGVEALRSHVTAQGLTYLVQPEDIFPYIEGAPEQPKLTILSQIWQSVRYGQSRRIRRHRFEIDRTLERLVENVRPDAMLVDSPYSFFSLGLRRTGVPYGILESMGNLQRDDRYPPHDTLFVPTASPLSRATCWLHWKRYALKRSLMGALGVRLDLRQRLVARVARREGVPVSCVDLNRYFHMGLSHIPEFILSPQHFDFPREPARNQYFVGPSVDLGRRESGFDYRFESTFSRCLADQERGSPIVYCSLGTAAWRYPGAEEFLRRIVAACRGQPWQLVAAIGVEMRTALPLCASNVHIFQTVPQLEVLRHAKLMLTHGGMNSITECILMGVPMIVLPGTKQIDQAGNAARVSYHGIGVTGSLSGSSVKSLRKMIRTLLDEPIYTCRIRSLGEKIRNSDAWVNGADIVLEALDNQYARSTASIATLEATLSQASRS